MFNKELKRRLLEQEMTIARLQEDLRQTCYRASEAEKKAAELEKEVAKYEYWDEEELELDRKLRKEALKAEIARYQIDRAKEVAEAFDVKPPAFK